MEIYQSGEFAIELKTGEFPITKADKAAHAIVTDHLGATKLPILSEEGADIGFNERKNWEYFWLIDPLDGTKEFIHKNGEFTVNIALVYKKLPVAGVIYAPSTDALYIGSKETGVYKIEKGIRIDYPPLTIRNQFRDLLQKKHLTIVASRSHISLKTRCFIEQFQNPTLTLLGSSLKFMRLLEKQADIYPRLEPTMEWDTAAAHAILNATNRGIYLEDMSSELTYNKPDLKNPPFISF